MTQIRAFRYRCTHATDYGCWADPHASGMGKAVSNDRPYPISATIAVDI